MEREAKAKVVAAVWGTEWLQFHATLAVLPWSIWKKRLNSSLVDNKTGNVRLIPYKPYTTQKNARFNLRNYRKEVKMFTAI